MNKIIKIKPSRFLIGFIALVPVSFLLVSVIAKVFGKNGVSISLLVFFGGFFGYFLFWLFTINYGLELLNIDKKTSSKFAKNKRLMIFLLTTYLVGIFIALPPFELNDSLIIKGIAILLGLAGFFSLTYLFHNITEDYIYQVKNRAPNLLDYFIVLFHFGFFPIGLLLIHSHVRLIMRDKGIIDF